MYVDNTAFLFSMTDKCISGLYTKQLVEQPEVEFVIKDHGAECLQMFVEFIISIKESCEKHAKEVLSESGEPVQ